MDDWMKEWPVLDILDFAVATVDVTKWEDGTYTVMFNLYQESKTKEPPYSGMTLCTQLGGKTLGEVYNSVMAILESGILGGIDVSASGTMWDADGNEIASINWNDYGQSHDDDDDSDIDISDNAFKIRGNTTLQ